MRGGLRLRPRARPESLMLVTAAVLAKVSGMSFKSRHTRHRAKSSVSPRATRLSVKKTARQRPKAKKLAR